MACSLRRQTPARTYQIAGIELAFVFHLLAAEHNGSKANTAACEQYDIVAIRNKSLKILIVDDHDGFRTSTAFKLTVKYNALVETAKSGQVCLEKLNANRNYDFIFLDLMMPGMNGIKTYKEIADRGVTAKIVCMSAYPSSEEWTQAQGLHLILLGKPLDDGKLTKILKEAL